MFDYAQYLEHYSDDAVGRLSADTNYEFYHYEKDNFLPSKKLREKIKVQPKSSNAPPKESSYSIFRNHIKHIHAETLTKVDNTSMNKVYLIKHREEQKTKRKDEKALYVK